MIMRPTYAYEVLIVKIHFASLNEIRDIAGLVGKEKDIYGLKAYNAIIATISKRLILLSKNSSSSNHISHVESFIKDKHSPEEKQALLYTSPAHL